MWPPYCTTSSRSLVWIHVIVQILKDPGILNKPTIFHFNGLESVLGRFTRKFKKLVTILINILLKL